MKDFSRRPSSGLDWYDLAITLGAILVMMILFAKSIAPYGP